ncbi:hypothetical protein B0H16DRAFT_1546721 [Mycena metata]|uniref:Uncharacterized protein n=1 Tax=Mycena metata TaxID=1033252 RepID=A0AAD7IX79_9AGAR|nr:hypothetical protein B0H16DRAFT_1546721 [Mycena metata]
MLFSRILASLGLQNHVRADVWSSPNPGVTRTLTLTLRAVRVGRHCAILTPFKFSFFLLLPRIRTTLSTQLEGSLSFKSCEQRAKDVSFLIARQCFPISFKPLSWNVLTLAPTVR